MQSFVALRSFPEVRSEADEEAFTALISRIKAKHSPTLPYIAQGIAELKSHMEVSHQEVVSTNEKKPRVSFPPSQNRGFAMERMTQLELPWEESPHVHHFLDEQGSIQRIRESGRPLANSSGDLTEWFVFVLTQ